MREDMLERMSLAVGSIVRSCTHTRLLASALMPGMGPLTGTKITPLAALVARDAFFWSWPLDQHATTVGLPSRKVATEPRALSDGIVPVRAAQPPDHAHRLRRPEERLVACPNQDVVYGVGMLALDQSPVVIQVPDFGDRFWVYQIVDLRTDSFAAARQDVRHHARLLPAGRPELAGRSAEGHHQGLPLSDQHRLRRRRACSRTTRRRTSGRSRRCSSGS